MINFTGKIPIATCRIENKKTQKSVPATFFEYDCKDLSDSIEVRTQQSLNKFKNFIAGDMKVKTSQINRGKAPDEDYFYGMQTKRGDIVAIAQTYVEDDSVHIDFIETNHKKYKHVGKNMLALIGKNMLEDKKGKKLVVDYALDEAVGFYTDGCNFQPKGNQEDKKFVLHKKGVKKLIENAQSKSKGLFVEV